MENLDFFTDKSLVDDPYDYYDAIRGCPVWREPEHGVVMVSGYDEAVAVQRDADQSSSVCNVVSGPWSGIPVETDLSTETHLAARRHTKPHGHWIRLYECIALILYGCTAQVMKRRSVTYRGAGQRFARRGVLCLRGAVSLPSESR
jgi:hypothetical protein